MPKNPANFPDRDIPPAIKAFIPDSKARSKINNYLNALTLPEFGGYVYELLSIYNRTVKAEVGAGIKKALETSEIKQLNMVRGEIETDRIVSGQIRALLREQDRWMYWLLKKIDDTLKQLGEKPVDAFYHPKETDEVFIRKPTNKERLGGKARADGLLKIPDKKGYKKVYKSKGKGAGYYYRLIEDVLCPHCGEVNRNFKYGELCAYCDELILSPWVEHTVCPECHKITTRSEIFQDKEGYDLNTQTDNINCRFCDSRFNWKKYRIIPEVFGTKTCISCERPYIPDKRNWKKQRVCKACKDNGKDSYRLDKKLNK